MNDEVHVETGELRSHANDITTLADRIANASHAAQYMAMGDEAYGLLGQPIAMNLQDQQETGGATLQSIADRLYQMATKIRTCASEYDRADDEFAQALKAIPSEVQRARGQSETPSVVGAADA